MADIPNIYNSGGEAAPGVVRNFQFVYLIFFAKLVEYFLKICMSNHQLIDRDIMYFDEFGIWEVGCPEMG